MNACISSLAHWSSGSKPRTRLRSSYSAPSEPSRRSPGSRRGRAAAPRASPSASTATATRPHTEPRCRARADRPARAGRAAAAALRRPAPVCCRARSRRRRRSSGSGAAGRARGSPAHTGSARALHARRPPGNARACRARRRSRRRRARRGDNQQPPGATGDVERGLARFDELPEVRDLRPVRVELRPPAGENAVVPRRNVLRGHAASDPSLHQRSAASAAAASDGRKDLHRTDHR